MIFLIIRHRVRRIQQCQGRFEFRVGQVVVCRLSGRNGSSRRFPIAGGVPDTRHAAIGPTVDRLNAFADLLAVQVVGKSRGAEILGVAPRRIFLPVP